MNIFCELDRYMISLYASGSKQHLLKLYNEFRYCGRFRKESLLSVRRSHGKRNPDH